MRGDSPRAKPRRACAWATLLQPLAFVLCVSAAQDRDALPAVGGRDDGGVVWSEAMVHLPAWVRAPLPSRLAGTNSPGMGAPLPLRDRL